MVDRPRIYIESCCFIEMAKHQIGSGGDRRNDIWFLWKLLDAAKDGEIDVFTSVLTIAECTHAEGNSDEKVRALFTRLLMSGQYVKLIQPTPFIAADARDLRWVHNIALGGQDGLHVASGLALKATELLTFDGGMQKKAEAIEALGMRVIRPAKTVCLPAKYRQEELLDGKVTRLRPAASSGSS